MKLFWCDVSLKVKASGSGTSTTIAWTAPPTPPPGKSGPKSLTTPATRGRTRSDETEQTIEMLAVLKISPTSSRGFVSLLQGTSVPHFHPRRLAGHQPGGRQQGHHLRCLLEPVLRRSEYLQGLPLWPDEDGLCVQVPRPGELAVKFSSEQNCASAVLKV